MRIKKSECRSTAEDSDHAKTREPLRKRKTNAERQREYRKRQKNKNIAEAKKTETQQFLEKVSQESQHSTIHIKVETDAGTSGTIENISDSSQESHHSEKLNLDIIKSRNAAYSKAYRDRKKFKLLSNIESEIQTQHIQNVPDSSEEWHRKRKTNAEKQREYRQRQKNKNKSIPEAKKRKFNSIPNVLDVSEESQRKRKINAERQRKYRQRLKNKNISEAKKRKTETQQFSEKLSQEPQFSMIRIKVETEAGTSGTIHHVPDSSRESHHSEKLNLDIVKLRNAAYSKAYRDRKKFKQFSNIESEIQLQKSQLVSHRHSRVDPADATSGSIQHIPDSSEELQRKRKTNAEKQGEYRKRQKNKKIPEEQKDVPDSLEESQSDTCGPGARADAGPDKYEGYDRHVAARVLFHQKFTQNTFGHACAVCDRLWFKSELKLVKDDFQHILRQIIENYRDGSTVAVCRTCHVSIRRNKIPHLSKHNGFRYPELPAHLPKLDIISERLICPRLPFMQIRRLRHSGEPGQRKMYGQTINVPAEANNMVRNLPRRLHDEHSVYINIQKRLIHKGHFLRGLVNENNLKIWLRFLVDTPLYREYGIGINESFFGDDDARPRGDIDDVGEHIPAEEALTAQQQTLLWDEDKVLCGAPGEGLSPDEHAEELCFPAIYLGQFRKYELTVTPFMRAASELRRADRRGAAPAHVLYLAMKMMSQRVRESLAVALRHISGAEERVAEADYVNTCIESNLAFLKSIPNSTWYWSGRKKDLFAMIGQLGRPAAFMTLGADEIKWTPLLKVLYKLKNNCDQISTEAIERLHPMERSDLVSEDPVTCAIYFNKLVNVLMTILMSKRNSPFGKFYVTHYFKRIEFLPAGSPRAHVLLWLRAAPRAALDTQYDEAVEMVTGLSSVAAADASGRLQLNTHRHSDACRRGARCRLDAPFMPSKLTLILSPMDKDDENYTTFRKQYASIRENLERHSFTDFDDFYNQNGITSDQQYYDIIRAGIDTPKVFMKRHPAETWHVPFNPFVFSLLRSNMDFQFILDEHSCAQYVVEYVNKTERGTSDLQKKIIQVAHEHPESDMADITRHMSIEMLNTVEMSPQEAAWYLLREPMSKSSTAVEYIPTVPPRERHKIRKIMEELKRLDNESTDLWKENIFDNYEKRPEYLNDVSLAQFVSKYYKQIKTGQYGKRKNPRIIRYRNYDMTDNYNEYRREMVTLHIPFRNEQEDILLDSKYISTYEENKHIIMEKRKEFESGFDIEKTMKICRQLCRDNDDDLNDAPEAGGIIYKPDDHGRSMAAPEAYPNLNLQIASLRSLAATARGKENLMPHHEFCEKMLLANEEQKEFLIHIIQHLLVDPGTPLQLLFTSPAGRGSTWTTGLAMDMYNRFYGTDGYCNAYITCAAGAVAGQTVRAAFKVTLSTFLEPLSLENVQLYRKLMKSVKVIFVDEASTIDAELVAKLDNRCKQMVGNHQLHFGGLDVIVVGDMRRLPPARAPPGYEPLGNLAQRAIGPRFWGGFEYIELKQVVRQDDEQFSSIQTKIGDGVKLNKDELNLIEGRFHVEEISREKCPDGVRMFFTNNSVDKYNNEMLRRIEDKVISTTTDAITGFKNVEQEAAIRQKLHKMNIINTGGLPHEIVFVINKYYMITTNVDVDDCLSMGRVGKLVHIEHDVNNEINRVWLEFVEDKVGNKRRLKSEARGDALNLSRTAVPIERRNCTVPLNRSKTIIMKRSHLPLIPAIARGGRTSRGASFKEIVYEYEKKHSLSLLYVALSRVTSIGGLDVTTPGKYPTEFKFHQGYRRDCSNTDLINDFKRLSENKLRAAARNIRDFMTNRRGAAAGSWNVERLGARTCSDSNILLLSETGTWTDDSISVPSFNCVVRFQGQNCRSGGFDILHDRNDSTRFITRNMSLQFRRSELNEFNAELSDIGEVCRSHVAMRDGRTLALVAAYVAPGRGVRDIIHFIAASLVIYSEHTMPIILGGDFNCNLKDEKCKPLVDFLAETFNLRMNNPTCSKTKTGSTIHAVFTRFIEEIQSNTFVSYFSYHRPAVVPTMYD